MISIKFRLILISAEEVATYDPMAQVCQGVLGAEEIEVVILQRHSLLDSGLLKN